jgi:hypothetical protein
MHALLLSLVAIHGQAVLPPIVVLATHDLPNETEHLLLTAPIPTWREKAEKAGYRLEEKDGVLFVHHENLFNLTRMEEILRGLGALVAPIKGGQRNFRMGELDPSVQKGVLRLFAGSAAGGAVGPHLLDAKSQFKSESRVRLQLTNGQRQINVSMPEPASPEPESFYRNAPSKEDREAFEKKRKELALPPYPDRLVFSFSKTSIPSARRAAIAEVFAKSLYDLLETQRKQYETLSGTLQAAFLGENRLPNANESLHTLGEATRTMLREQIEGDYRRYGFDNADQARAFLDDATVGSLSVSGLLFLGIVRPDGKKELLGVSMDFTRNPSG